MMARIPTHYRILEFPGDRTLGGGCLQTLRLETRRGRQDIILEYEALELTEPAHLFEREGRPWERVRGQYVPRRLRFVNAQFVQGQDIGSSLIGMPGQHPDRLIYAGLAWRTPEGESLYMVDLRRPKDDTLLLSAQGCVSESVDGAIHPAEFERDWSPPPLSPGRLIPMPRSLWQKFGGNPVTLRLDGRKRPLRLFVGGIDIQPDQRPEVGAVLNLAGNPSRWCVGEPAHPADRWAHKGEGSKGMRAADLAQEAGWVIERLQRGERVLVHCSAGMNRSSSVCCAVLILLEGLSAEAALERVREQHPWARPDPRHWLALRWLAWNHGNRASP